MNFLKALRDIKKEGKSIITNDPHTKDYNVLFLRLKDVLTLGEHSSENKEIHVNIDRLFLHFVQQNNYNGFKLYTLVPRFSISQELYDSLIITTFHEKNHALDKLMPRQRLSDSQARLFALESIAFTNALFYKENYPRSISESRSCINSINESKKYFISKGFTEEESKSKIINALNLNATKNYLLHRSRSRSSNPLSPDVINSDTINEPISSIPSSDDYKFRDWNDVEERIKEIKEQSSSHNYGPKSDPGKAGFTFYLIDLPLFSDLNESLLKSNINNPYFLSSLSPEENLYLEISILKEYSSIELTHNKNIIRSKFESRITKFRDFLDPNFVDLGFFQDKANNFRENNLILYEPKEIGLFRIKKPERDPEP